MVRVRLRLNGEASNGEVARDGDGTDIANVETLISLLGTQFFASSQFSDTDSWSVALSTLHLEGGDRLQGLSLLEKDDVVYIAPPPKRQRSQPLTDELKHVDNQPPDGRGEAIIRHINEHLNF